MRWPESLEVYNLDAMANRDPNLTSDGSQVTVRDSIGIPENAATVTPSDSTTFSPATTALFIGSTGNLSVAMAGGQVVTFLGVAAGMFVGKFTKVMASGTTASSIVRLW